VAESPARVTHGDRAQQIVDVLVDAFSELMTADADAFRTKFRKMAADPFAFYRGTACLFYADMAELDDRWCDERTGRVWIQGDLHAENFGTSTTSTRPTSGTSAGTCAGSAPASRSWPGARPSATRSSPTCCGPT
jgi:hypothetical protein